MRKLIKDNKVAVLYSPGCGAGLYTWNDDKEKILELIFLPELITYVLEVRKNEKYGYEIDLNKVIDILNNHLELNISGDIDDYYYLNGMYKAQVEWLNQGAPFHIDVTDTGSEYIVTDFLYA